MKSHFKLIFIFVLLFGVLNSCRYSLPLIKIRINKKVDVDSSVYSKTNTFRYRYFRISRYGIIGSCWKHIQYDSSGNKKEKRVSKQSSRVCDGYTTEITKKIEYDQNGKKVKKTFKLSKSGGWGPNRKVKEKTIENLPDGKRRVTRNKTSGYKRHIKSDGKRKVKLTF